MLVTLGCQFVESAQFYHYELKYCYQTYIWVDSGMVPPSPNPHPPKRNQSSCFQSSFLYHNVWGIYVRLGVSMLLDEKFLYQCFLYSISLSYGDCAFCYLLKKEISIVSKRFFCVEHIFRKDMPLFLGSYFSYPFFFFSFFFPPYN